MAYQISYFFCAKLRMVTHGSDEDSRSCKDIGAGCSLTYFGRMV